jgi:hypothetical protein
VASALFAVEQMLEGVLHLLAFLRGAIGFELREQSYAGEENDEQNYCKCEKPESYIHRFTFLVERDTISL